MTCVLLLISVALGASSLILFARIGRARRALVPLFRDSVSGDGLGAAVSEWLLEGIDTSLLGSQGKEGFDAIEVVYREHHDRYRTVSELLSQLGPALAAKSVSELNQFVKLLFQLQSTLALPSTNLARCLQIVEQRYKSDSAVAKPIYRIEIPVPGAILDSRTMMPLNAGTHVKQSLGVIAFDRDGKAICKAKVICS